jgi:hypothetical protein
MNGNREAPYYYGHLTFHRGEGYSIMINDGAGLTPYWAYNDDGEIVLATS